MRIGFKKRDEGPKKVGQVEFVENIEGLLKAATAPSTELKHSLSSARKVSSELGAVASGELVVQPPLGHEQFTSLREKANTIINIGEKASSSLAQAEQSRASGESQAFKGGGSGVKS